MGFSRALTAIIFLGIVSCFSCAYKQQQVLFEQRASASDTIQNNQLNSSVGAGTSGYRIKSQDILQIRNLQSSKFIVDDAPLTNLGGGNTAAQGQAYQVEDDGTVALPVIGHVAITGLTRAEAAKKIEGLYRTALLKDPIIELKIINLKVTVLGETRAQGNFPLIKDRTTLVEMIGEAGGLTERANEKNIKIIRGDAKNPQVTIVDLSKIKTLSDPAIILQNNDIIYIAQNKRAIKTDQLQNLSTTIQPVIILLNTALIIYTLIHR